MSTPDELRKSLHTKLDALKEPHELETLLTWFEQHDQFGRKKLKDCFVIMPFSKTKGKRDKAYWTRFFDDFLKPSLKQCGYSARRSQADPNNIVGKIMEDLALCDMVVAVLTDGNPNVWYELGVRHSQRRGTVLVCEQGQRVPFDLAHNGIAFYKPSCEIDPFVSELKKHFAEAAKEAKDSPVSEFLNSGLITCINKSLAAKREALAIVQHALANNTSPESALEMVDILNQKWRSSERQITIVKDDKILRHRGEVPIGANANICWKDTTSNSQSLYPYMKESGSGLRLCAIERLHGRITAVAFDTIRAQQWLVVVESHLYQADL